MLSTSGSIDLWWGSLADLEPHHEYYCSVLSPDEQSRMQAYRFAECGRMFALIRGWVRTALATYTEDDPAELQVGYKANGKPVLIQQPTHSFQDRLEFNVSHSDDHFALAVTRGGRLGLDVERIRKVDNMDTIARIYFSEADRQALLQAKDQKDLLFLKLWTQFEARYKAFGLEVDRLSTRSIYSRTWELTPGYVASLICERAEASLRWISWKGTPGQW